MKNKEEIQEEKEDVAVPESSNKNESVEEIKCESLETANAVFQEIEQAVFLSGSPAFILLDKKEDTDSGLECHVFFTNRDVFEKIKGELIGISLYDKIDAKLSEDKGK
jgi:hypothetical protein